MKNSLDFDQVGTERIKKRKLLISYLCDNLVACTFNFLFYFYFSIIFQFLPLPFSNPRIPIPRAQHTSQNQARTR